MKTEIQHAVTFLVEKLKYTLPNTSDVEKKLDAMRTLLTNLLAEKYENHWYADKPLKGSAFRCINISVEENSIDVCLRTASNDSGLTEEVVRGVFCDGLALWVDPDDVSGRLGKGAIFPIYKNLQNKSVPSERVSSDPPTHHRPQQRPRSISPPHSHDVHTDPMNLSRPITNVSPKMSKTPPPGFRSRDADQNPYTVQPTSQAQMKPGLRANYSDSNLQMLWRDPASRSTSNVPHVMNTRQQISYAQSKTNKNSTQQQDDVFSFNQYSSYYNPHFHWKEDRSTHSQSDNVNAKSYLPLKSLWQDNEGHQRTHLFGDGMKCNTNKLAVAGNGLTVNKVQNYGYDISRRAQEVY